MIDNLDSVRYKKQINTLVDRIKEIVDNSNYNDDLRKFLQNYSEICKREKVYIVFAGEYSTGKSSIIRALTGDSSIKISEEPTTDKEIVYNYNSYCVVDTPGLYSGNNNHDSIANDAYKKADYVVFCISANNLFNRDTLDKFIEIYKLYSDRLILCVNKIDLETNDNIISYFDDIDDEIYNLFDEKNIQFNEIYKISAKKYLDAQNLSDEKRKAKEDASYFKDFVNGLNEVGKNKSTKQKCLNLVNLVLDFIEKILDNEQVKGVETSEQKRKEKMQLKDECLKVDNVVENYKDWAEKTIIDVRNTIKERIENNIEFSEINKQYSEYAQLFHKQSKKIIEKNFKSWLIDDDQLFSKDEYEDLVNFINYNVNSGYNIGDKVSRGGKVKKPEHIVDNSSKLIQKLAKAVKIPETKMKSKFFGLIKKTDNAPKLSKIQKTAQFIQENGKFIEVAASAVNLVLDVSVDIWNAGVEKKKRNQIFQTDKEIQAKMGKIMNSYVEISVKIDELIKERLTQKANFCNDIELELSEIKRSLESIKLRLGDNIHE